FMDRILAAFGASPDTIAYARQYMVIVLPGMFLTTIAFNLTGLIRSSGYPRRAMWILAGGAVLNIILDTIFIYALDWGIAGAAWATTISMACSAVAAILHFINPKSFIHFTRDCWSPRWYIFLNILSIGLSPFLMNVAASGVVALLNRQLIRYGNLVMPGGGDLAVGACGISNTFGALLVMFILGVCQGMQPIAGYNYGAGRQERLKEVFTLTLKVNILFGTAGALIGVLFPQTLLRIFTTDADLIRIGTPAMRYLLVMWGIIAFTITNSNFFQSIDKPWIAIVTSLSRQVIFLAPMIYILPPLYERMNLHGLTGIWMSCAVSDVLGAVLAGSLLLTQRHIFRPGYQAPPRRQRKAFRPSPGDEA
ncbi:MAG: polysaccharide biosynthesis C-terminal domain-containing protein, partial [Bacteroidales bacterium]|nr:polysaccharide biosynthesis C-terminal domain-containing protein [Bacteroidales bacterium]